MDQDNDFEPDGLNTATDGAGNVRLRFYRDDGREVSIVMPGSSLPFLLQELQRLIGSSGGQTISAVDLQVGRAFRTVGRQVRKTPDGGAVLTLGMEFSDPHRVVTLPIQLSPEQVKTLAQDLIG